MPPASFDVNVQSDQLLSSIAFQTSNQSSDSMHSTAPQVAETEISIIQGNEIIQSLPKESVSQASHRSNELIVDHSDSIQQLPKRARKSESNNIEYLSNDQEIERNFNELLESLKFKMSAKADEKSFKDLMNSSRYAKFDYAVIFRIREYLKIGLPQTSAKLKPRALIDHMIKEMTQNKISF